MHLTLRQSERSDLPRLMQFYEANASEALPAPTIATIGSAIDDGRLLIVEENAGQPILASAAILDFSARGWRTYVGELSGTCVTEALGGYGPLNFQRILLAARLLGHAAMESENGPGCSSTLLTVIKAENDRSVRNVIEAGFIEVYDKPYWMRYEEHAWLGSGDADDWRYFCATDETVRAAYEDFDELGMFDGPVELSRRNRDTGDREVVTLHARLNDLMMARDDLALIRSGKRSAGLSPPPDDLG